MTPYLSIHMTRGADRRFGIHHLYRHLVVIIALIWLWSPPAIAEEAKVTITGGVDPTGQNYAWTVSNNFESPIVYVEFPHYQAALFFVPEGWTPKCTYLVNVGVPDKPGVCTAWPEPPNSGILHGESAEFRMQLSVRGARTGKRTALIRFADGKEIAVKGVELPVPDLLGEKYLPLIGSAIIFILWVTVRTLRRRRKTNEDSDQAPITSES